MRYFNAPLWISVLLLNHIDKGIFEQIKMKAKFDTFV